MFRFIRKGKSKQENQIKTKIKTRSQTKQSTSTSSKQLISAPIQFIKTSNSHSKEIHSIEHQLQNQCKSSFHFELNDIQDIQSFFNHHYHQKSPCSLLDLLNLISISQSDQSTTTKESNVKLSISIQSTHSLQSTNSLHSSNQTLKGKGKRSIEEEDDDDHLESDYEFINPLSPLKLNLNSNIQNHTTPTKKIKIEKSNPKFDFNSLSTSTYSSTLKNQNQPKLFHGLSNQIWNQIFQFINQSTLNQIQFTSNSNQDINLKNQIDLLIKFQIESHQFQLISKTLLPLTKSNSWSFLFLNNYQKIHHITRLLESNSSLTQFIKTCYIILPLSNSTYKTPRKSSNRQSMSLLNEKHDEFSEASMIRSRSSTLLTSLVTHSPIKSNQKRFETPKTPTRLNINSNELKLEDENLYIQEIPSLLFSLSINLKTLYINSTERICTKLLNSLSNLSHQFSLLESLIIIGGGDYIGLMGLINGLSLLPLKSNLKKLIVTGPSLTMGGNRYKENFKQNQLNRSTSNSIHQSHHFLELIQIEIGNGIPLNINQIHSIIKKIKPNTLISLKFNLSLIDLKNQNDQNQFNLKFNQIFKHSSNTLKHLSIEEDWFNSINSLESELKSELKSESSSKSSSKSSEEFKISESKSKSKSKSESKSESSEESKEGMKLDQTLMNLNRLNSLDLSNFKSFNQFCSPDLFNFLPITLIEIKLFNPNYQIFNHLINDEQINLKNLEKIEIFGCHLKNRNRIGNGNGNGNRIGNRIGNGNGNENENENENENGNENENENEIQEGNSIRNHWNVINKLNKLGIQVIFN